MVCDPSLYASPNFSAERVAIGFAVAGVKVFGN